MTDPVAVALVLVWLLSGGAAVAVLAWLYRREVARAREAEPVVDVEAGSEWRPEWGWPDRP